MCYKFHFESFGMTQHMFLQAFTFFVTHFKDLTTMEGLYANVEK